MREVSWGLPWAVNIFIVLLSLTFVNGAIEKWDAKQAQSVVKSSIEAHAKNILTLFRASNLNLMDY